MNLTELQIILLLDGALANMPDYSNENQDNSDPNDPLARFRPKKAPSGLSDVQNFFGDLGQ